MSYRETDGPFGLLPKKTAMDLEWFGTTIPVPNPKAPPRAASDPTERPDSTRAREPLPEGESTPWGESR